MKSADLAQAPFIKSLTCCHSDHASTQLNSELLTYILCIHKRLEVFILKDGDILLKTAYSPNRKEDAIYTKYAF